MPKSLKIILLILLGLFIVIQLIPSDRPANEPADTFSFFRAYDVPQDVEKILRESCFDCHSQEVRYPWYSYVAPVSWLVSRDVRIGRANLDFSRWNELEKKEKIKLASEIGEEVDIESMPMPIYLVLHRNAVLDEGERQLILSWSEELAEKMFEE